MTRSAPLAVAVFATLLVACGGAKESRPAPANASAAAEAEPVPAPVPPATALRRADLDAFLAQGPSYALGLVRVAPVMDKGAFVGFRIVAFRAELPPYLDLREGDVVRRVNDLPISTPDEFFAVFQALSAAANLSTIPFDIVRGGENKKIDVPVEP